MTHAVSYLNLGVSSLIIDPQHLVLRKRKIQEIKKQKNKIKKKIKKVKRGGDGGEGGQGMAERDEDTPFTLGRRWPSSGD